MINKNFKIRTKIKTKNIIESSEKENRLEIHDNIFSNKIDVDQYIEWNSNSLARINFINYTFEILNLLRMFFGSCEVKNYKFNNLNFQKCQFLTCKFKNY